MSFIDTYGGNKEASASGMAAVQRAIDAGMTISQIQAQAKREGIGFGSKAQNYIREREGSFIAKYGGNEATMANAGVQAVRAASAAGLSYDEMRQQAAAEGVQFMGGAQEIFAQARESDYQNKLAEMQQQQNAYLKQLQIQQKSRADELEANQLTYYINQARSNKTGALHIGGSNKTPRTSGTQGFKRRKLQINPVTANALSSILGGTKSATTTNTLNV